MTAPDRSSLRGTITRASTEAKSSLGALTVMSNQTDPYRVDTPANHRDAAWFAQAWTETGARRGIHLRGLHYALVSVALEIIKPDGTPYRNTIEDWTFLQSVSGRARWLGYVAFEDIVDERNAPPILMPIGERAASVGLEDNADLIQAPRFEMLLPKLQLNFAQRQAYRLAFIGEKQSLAEVLRPIAYQHEAEIVLPTGELSTTLLYGIVARAAADGRPCRIFYLADFDPTGFHMPVEVSRKLQALVDSRFHGLDIQLRRLALTHDQVQSLGLPSTPMKDSERRADKWRARWNCEQTEIDALATLRPEVLRKIVKDAIAPYWDATLASRVIKARVAYETEAAEVAAFVIASHGPEMDRVRDLYDSAIETARLAYVAARPLFTSISDEILDALPEPELPEPEPIGDISEAIFDSKRDWLAQTRVLLAEKVGDEVQT